MREFNIEQVLEYPDGKHTVQITLQEARNVQKTVTLVDADTGAPIATSAPETYREVVAGVGFMLLFGPGEACDLAAVKAKVVKEKWREVLEIELLKQINKPAAPVDKTPAVKKLD